VNDTELNSVKQVSTGSILFPTSATALIKDLTVSELGKISDS